jgi:hypothetical protein
MAQKFLEKRTRNYSKGCARAMLFSGLAANGYYKGLAPNHGWLARKALNARPNWKQVSKTVFVYALGPNNEGSLEPGMLREYDPWLNGTLDITDDKSLWDVIQDVVRTELYWNYLRDVEIWKCLKLMDLAVVEASKFLNIKLTETTTARAA